MRGAIPLYLLLHASSVLGGSEQPRGNHTWCDGSGACYSAHLAPLPFSRAQEACAQRGGALSTASGEAEVRAVLALLREVAAEPGSRAFWLGLRRRAQHCTQPDLPLRGFLWTDGRQRAPQEEVAKWVKEPSKSCTTQRCAALQVTAGQQDLEPWGWEERPCKSSPHGYICKYQYDGACPAPRPQAARSLLYSLPYGLHSAALDFSPPGTQLLGTCPAPRGDVQVLLVCEPGRDGYSWAGAEMPLCPCLSGDQSPSTGACVEPGDCIGVRGAPLCLCGRGFLRGADEQACVRPGGTALAAAGTGPSTLAQGSSAAPSPPASPQPSSAGEMSASSSSSYVFLLVTMAVVTVVILVVAVLGVFKICFTKSPSWASPDCKEQAPAAAESDAEANTTLSNSEKSLEARSKEAGGDKAEAQQGEPKPEEEAPAGN
uniref:C-type lectin domain containing 14A n=1 Tax=Pelusios castaneus TaxID=367368 RepID=A0A8C8SLL0_9SAUR